MEKLKALNELRKALKERKCQLSVERIYNDKIDTQIEYKKISSRLKEVKKEIYNLIEKL